VYRDTSVALKPNESGFVDKILNDSTCININADGYTFAKVRIRSDRIPMIGDKFSSAAAQKGTCGILYRHEDMPFTTSGIVPDLIMNPHAIPSRMTIAQLLGCMMSNAACAIGSRGDGTPFGNVTVEDISKILVENGFDSYGDEIMFNPHDGRMMSCKIFFGPAYYQRLKHMVADKTHSRSQNGPIVMLTRQPAEGRSREGGLRTGEMELDCLEAHGALTFLQERTMKCSDSYMWRVCKECGRPCVDICKACGNNHSFADLNVPYAFKLLTDELAALHISTRFLSNP
jgi:DNA-directed RNA polymerase II subunit RPB2